MRDHNWNKTRKSQTSNIQTSQKLHCYLRTCKETSPPKYLEQCLLVDNYLYHVEEYIGRIDILFNGCIMASASILALNWAVPSSIHSICSVLSHFVMSTSNINYSVTTSTASVPATTSTETASVTAYTASALTTTSHAASPITTSTTAGPVFIAST